MHAMKVGSSTDHPRMQFALYALSTLLALAALGTAVVNLQAAFTAQLSAAWIDIACIAAALLLILIHPRTASLVAVAAFAVYFAYHGLIFDLGKTVAFALTTAYTSYAFARSLTVRHGGSVDRIYVYAWTIALSTVTLLCILLLLLQAFTSVTLFLSMASLFLYALRLNPKGERIQLLLEPIAALKSTFIFGTKTRASGILTTSLLLVVLLYGIGYLSVLALAGDARHAYLAFARAYAEDNTFLLNDPSYRWSIGYAFPHLQELLVSVGYALDQRLGARFIGLLIIVGKLHVLYLFARQIVGLTQQRATLLVLCFTLVPMIFDIQLGIRPDNLMSLILLLLVYFLERSLLLEKEGADLKTQLLLCLWLSALLASTKLTAGFALLVLPILYGRLILPALRILPRFGLPQWLAVSASIAIAAWWWVRNIWFLDIPMIERGANSLSGFPPLRSISSVYSFLTEGLLRTSGYTEFADFGYGLWGVLLIPLALIGLADRPLIRRLALIFLLYSALLLSFFSQIRYLAAIIPFAFLAVFGNQSTCRLASWLQRGKTRAAALSLAVVFISSSFVALASRGVPGRRSSAYSVIASRISGSRSDIRSLEPWATFNQLLTANDRIMAGRMVYMYDIDGRLHVTRELEGFFDFYRHQQENQVGYLIEFPYLMGSRNNPLFNDHLFLETVGSRVREAGLVDHPRLKARLYRVNLPVLNSIEQELRRSKDLTVADAFVVSTEVAKKFASTHVLGEQLCVDGLTHPLYLLHGQWIGSPLKYLRDIKTETGGDSCVYKPLQQDVRCEGNLKSTKATDTSMALSLAVQDATIRTINIAFSIKGSKDWILARVDYNPMEAPLELDFQKLGQLDKPPIVEEARIVSLPRPRPCALA